MKLLLSTLLAIWCTQGYSASFDCAKAASLSEVTICNDNELSNLDSELGIIYKKAKTVAKDKKQFKTQSIAIFKWREKNCYSRDCLINWYKQRKVSLEKIINKTLGVEKKVKGITEIFGDKVSVFDPVSNVRERPDGGVLCKIKTVKNIEVRKYDDDWYSTNACGKLGVIHKSQIQFPKIDSGVSEKENKEINKQEPLEDLAKILSEAPIEALILLSQTYNNKIDEESKTTLMVIQVTIGMRLSLGVNTEKNLPKAFKWYMKAAINGEASAEYYIAEAYRRGNGVEKNINQSNTWYKKAVNQGNPDALLVYGLFQMLGKNGVEKNIGEGYKKISKLAEDGNEKAKTLLKTLLNSADKN